MNLLAAIIIFWNTMKLGEVVANQEREGRLLSPDLLTHGPVWGRLREGRNPTLRLWPTMTLPSCPLFDHHRGTEFTDWQGAF
ncbi:hypothetical protein PMI09_03183 [Rhizobium sp. CF122]|nr:hypothetical protein PMI09_03183 [Rhizobium sp. CF122]